MTRYNYFEVQSPWLIYIGVEDRKAFELIDVPEEPEVDTATGGRVRSKLVEQRGVSVCFQYWVIPDTLHHPPAPAAPLQ